MSTGYATERKMSKGVKVGVKISTVVYDGGEDVHGGKNLRKNFRSYIR